LAKIAILDDYQGLATTLADWSDVTANHEVVVFDRHMPDPAELVPALMPFDAVCLMRERTGFGAEIINALPNLKLIVTAGMRNAAIDLAAADARGIVVSGTPQNSHATAELTLGLMLSMARHIAPEAANMRAGGWQSTLGMELDGKTLGLIGLGHLGGKVAGYGHALGMPVIGWSQNLTEERAKEVGARKVTKEELFQQADVISIHVKLSERSRGLVGAAELSAMKPTAFIINTSRGPIIERAALLNALKTNEIAGAALDVYDEEPLPADDELRNLPNTLLTPHLGYWTRDNLKGWYQGMAESVAAWLNDAPIRVLKP
jgi:phosphoglycerate dehydrogenase-like enzyme